MISNQRNLQVHHVQRGIFQDFPHFLKLFELFWPNGPVLLRIARVSYRSATIADEYGISPGRATWEHLIIVGMKVFFVCTILIGLKRQPNWKY
jgi:hypothetical protein